jgi:ATP-dependent helicase/DNAse subunit B
VTLALLTGPANAGKAELVLDAICAHVARGAEPLLIVPTSADVHRYRRELAEGRLVLGARIEQFEGLIEEMAKRAQTTPRTISPITREHILTQLHRRVRPDQPAADSRGFARALARFIGELESEHVTPQRLRAALGTWSAAAGNLSGAADEGEWLGELFVAYQEVLAGMDRADKELRAVWALDELRRTPARWGAKPVLFYGFDDLTTLQLDAIETLAAVVDAPVTVSLAYEPGRRAFAGRAGAFHRLEPFADEHTRLQPRADYYESSSREALHHLERFLFEENDTRVCPGRAVRLLQAGGERAELELIGGEIRVLLDRGSDPAQIAVVHRSPRTIVALLEDVFGQYAIPFALEHERAFRDTSLGAGLLGLLHCALGGASSQELLRWLRVPGLLSSPQLADRLELECRRTGARSAAAAREIWEREHWPLETIDHLAAAAARGPLALIARLQREAEWLFAAARRRAARVLEPAELDEARALVAVSSALAELRELAGGGQLTITAGELTSVLEELELQEQEHYAPGAVAVLGPLALRARRVRTLFLCGLQEGVFPQPLPSEPLLGPEQRRGLAQAAGLLIGPHRDQLASERYLLYACLSRPESELVLSWHDASDDGTPCAPSLFIEDICDVFDDSLRVDARRRSLGELHWPGPGPLPAALAYRERALACEPRSPRAIDPLTEPMLLSELKDSTVWSASALETWARCPVRWFVERMLRAKDVEPEPEPMSRGALAHAVLKDTLHELKETTGSARLTPDNLTAALELLRAKLEQLAGSFKLSASPERAAGALRRLRADLERYLEHAAEIESPLEPTHLELEFGFEQDGLPSLELGEGVRLRGRIDRIDVDDDGRAVLYDYKSKSAAAQSKWLADGHFQLPLYMRAARELLGLEPVGGFYQPLSGADLRGRGVLRDDQALELPCVRSDLVGPDVFVALMEETLTAARVAARQAAQGALEPRPESCDWEGGRCMYPSICRCGR